MGDASFGDMTDVGDDVGIVEELSPLVHVDLHHEYQ